MFLAMICIMFLQLNPAFKIFILVLSQAGSLFPSLLSKDVMEVGS
jgi:hypothetical protein